MEYNPFVVKANDSQAMETDKYPCQYLHQYIGEKIWESLVIQLVDHVIITFPIFFYISSFIYVSLLLILNTVNINIAL